tara:strand:+ start:2300 stop:2683 length:384 start_codon:yes stop_codon:yes gene_type:complete
MKLTNKQIKRIIKEEKFKLIASRVLAEQEGEEPAPSENNGHGWPRVDWNDVGNLVDKWQEMELKAFDKGDPSMVDGHETLQDAKENWDMQVEDAALDMEAELTERVRQLALSTMQEFTNKLVNGDYA